MSAIVHQQLRSVLNRSMQDTTTRFGGIQLSQAQGVLSEDVCTVHTTLEGGHRAALLLWADVALVTRLAQNILGTKAVTPKDIEETATEYFNIVCGRIAAGLYQTTRIPSRFQVPRFRSGRYLPEEYNGHRCVLHYTGNSNECIQLIYLAPPSSDQPSSS